MRNQLSQAFYPTTRSLDHDKYERMLQFNLPFPKKCYNKTFCFRRPSMCRALGLFVKSYNVILNGDSHVSAATLWHVAHCWLYITDDVSLKNSMQKNKFSTISFSLEIYTLGGKCYVSKSNIFQFVPNIHFLKTRHEKTIWTQLII